MTPRSLAVVVAACAAVSCASRQPARTPAAPVVVGLVVPLTGPEAAFGTSVENGARLAVEARNRDGGVGGREVSLRAIDSEGRPEGAAAAFTAAVVRDGAVAVLGEVTSSRTLAMAPAADELRVPILSPSATHPKVTRDGSATRPFVFRACVIDPAQGSAMARFARSALAQERVAILVDRENGYSTSLAATFRTAWEASGGIVVTEIGYATGATDFGRQLDLLRATGTRLVYVPGYYPDVALVARQARALGLDLRFLGGDGWASDKLHALAAGSLEGSYFTDHGAVDDPDPAVASFVKRYREAYGRDPDALAVYGYDAAGLLLDAMRRAGSLTPPAIRDALEQTRGFPAVTGSTTLDAWHDAVKPLVVVQVQGRAARFVTRVPPEPSAR